jgi:hypothetical protein
MCMAGTCQKVHVRIPMPMYCFCGVHVRASALLLEASLPNCVLYKPL